mmetsp:Transcript_8329/g.12828  ORF Transcript_8329/g.12828 Transcript_8329/m.12828 type:complete len:341 (-) Transcript_8329:19-1041(-)
MNSLIISSLFNAQRWASHCFVWILLVLSLEKVDAFVPCRTRTVCVGNNVSNQMYHSVPKQNRIPTTSLAALAITDEATAFSSSLSLSLEPVAVLWARSITESYGTSLVNHPLTTKSLTAGLLCGISDVIAQIKQQKGDSYNIARTIRFASKGCLGGIIWMYWYEWIDHFLLNDSGGVSYNSIWTRAILPASIGDSVQSFAQNHRGAVTTMLSMVMEQFLWCPVVYGMFEIPLATLLNGGTIQSIPTEINTKLQGLLVSNAKVWTPANLLIYNAPLEWRLVLSNIMDVFWQSIVSDVAADCGGDKIPVLVVEEEGTASTTTTTTTAERPSFAVVEKSRISS